MSRQINMARGIFYIYVLKNDIGNVKIGITKNFTKRLLSLSGSNCGGSKIINYFVSEATYVYNIEHIMHEKFNRNRIEGTEWFKGVEYEVVVQELQSLMKTESYIAANQRYKIKNEDFVNNKIKKEKEKEYYKKVMSLDIHNGSMEL